MKIWKQITILAIISLFLACDNGGDRQLKIYTVTFNADNGTENNTQIINEGNKATKPTNPSKNGYAFGYWFNEAVGIGYEWDFNTVITENIFLKARWNLLLDKTYSIAEKYRGKWDVYSATIDGESYAASPFGSFNTIGYEIGEHYTKRYENGTIASDMDPLYSIDDGDSGFIFCNWLIDGQWAPPPYLRISTSESDVIVYDYAKGGEYYCVKVTQFSWE